MPPREVHDLETVPYDWRRPRVSAVVHHGGAGTTALELQAGTLSVICPFVADQPFWAERVAALGVGPNAVPQRHLTAEKLAAAIGAAVTDPDMRARTERLGAQLQLEDGAGAAVAVIEGLSASLHTSSASRRVVPTA